MLMSKSRLEKFLYALYSLDSSDLPTPLSRIEELYKCLVTGEEPPTFEPLSRVEKYLMAILGGYDVDSLPNPLSRVEVLLYKLATGDCNLDDVKSFLSEHEELLAEIIRNGGVGGNINIEYVLYTLSTEHGTLYNTAKKPVKSAILKGNTLVNINRPITRNDSMKVENGLQILTTWTTAYNLWMVDDITLFKTNTKYYIIVEVIDNTLTSTWSPMIGSNDCVFSGGIPSLSFASGETGIKRATFTTKSDFTNVRCGLRSATGTNETVGSILKFRIAIIEYQDGMENWDIPYFEGMQSVKMPVLTTVGKNLWYGDKDVFIANGIEYFNISFKKGTYYFTGDVDTVYPDGLTTIVFSNTSTGYEVGAYINKSYSSAILKEDCDQVKIYTNGWSFDNSTNKPQTIENLMLSDTYPISYEPYKSNILTVNEDVELRAVGDVKDELNLITGELTQRVEEIVWDGSEDENWEFSLNSYEKIAVFRGERPTNAINGVTPIICDKLPITDPYNKGEVGIRFYPGAGQVMVGIEREKMQTINVNGFKQWLTSNPIVVQYQLEIELVKTVDLSTVNQDGNDTKLSTFNDITYVTLSSEGLIPEAELEVATKNEEVLNTMSLEMDDISTTQTTLEETSDTQSENVDATMIATTEIYEQLL